MRTSNASKGIIAGIAFWVVALVIHGLYFGFLNALINPFSWWLSFKEGLEFLLWIGVGGGSIGYFLSNLGVPEAGQVLSGLFGTVGWILAGPSMYAEGKRTNDSRSSLYALLTVFYNPTLTFVVTYLFYHNKGQESDPGPEDEELADVS